MKKLIVLLMASALMGVHGTASAEDIKAGEQKGTTICSACHGSKGISLKPELPNLAGQQKEYMIKQLKAFKVGTRTDSAMSPMAMMLEDADIENVAAYFSSLKCSE